MAAPVHAMAVTFQDEGGGVETITEKPCRSDEDQRLTARQPGPARIWCAIGPIDIQLDQDCGERTTKMDERALAAAFREIGRGYTAAAALLEGPPDASQQSGAALMREFDKAPGEGLTMEEASLACRRHGFRPQTVGAWARAGWLETRAEDGATRRYLTSQGRKRLAELANG